MADADPPPPARPACLWRSRRVLLTRRARDWAHGRAIAGRVAALGVAVTELPGDRLDLAGAVLHLTPRQGGD